MAGMELDTPWTTQQAPAPRTAEDMALDIMAHVDAAMADRLQRWHRGFPATQLGQAVRRVMEAKLTQAGVR